MLKSKQSRRFENSKTCVAIEYPLHDKDINGTIIELSGRYPEKGLAVNLECKELAYVVKGEGILVVKGKKYSLEEGDVVLIEPNEKYFWQGNMMLFMVCTPAWSPKQHKIIM